MKGRLPQITLPTGAPNPFDKQNVTLSTNLPARKQQQRSGMVFHGVQHQKNKCKINRMVDTAQDNDVGCRTTHSVITLVSTPNAAEALNRRAPSKCTGTEYLSAKARNS